MGKYFLLQLKRVARFVPFGLCVVLVLFGCLSLVFNAFMAAEESGTVTAKMQIGLVGTADDKYLQWGLVAMQFDSAMLSLDIKQMEEADAAAALQNGEIAAYVVFPEGFVEDALYGNVGKLRFVSTAGAAGLVSVIKEELTDIIGDILNACQSGAYGLGEALNSNGRGELWNKHVNDLALEYVDFLFDRAKVYKVQNLQRYGGVPIDSYMISGLTVLLMMLSCLPFAPLFITSDDSLQRMLHARGMGVFAQIVGEFAAYFAGLALLFGVVSAVVQGSGLLPENVSLTRLFLGVLPTLVMVAALSYCLFSISSHLVSGVLLSFVAVLVLGFIGGCMYPIWFFPDSVQQLAAVLPSGIARSSLTGCMMGAEITGTGALLAYSAAFLILAAGIRSVKTGKVRG